LQAAGRWGKLRAMSAPPIVVALSGGVDSATCAGLLVEAGERVVGISMRLYNAQGSAAASGGRCCGPRDLEDARAVCAHLGIPFYVADYEEDFRRAVIDDFVSSYREGRTPNPCVRCNEKVKFLPLLHRARALGALALCTGHYARIGRGSDGTPRLRKAIDPRKDQSYFLFGMPWMALDYVRFPLGDLTKEEVRAHARRLGLPNADKAESQEICFVPDGDYAGFVERQTGLGSPSGGDIVDESGAVVGHHDGVHRYTVGQRRGLGGGNGAPQYVVSIDALKRRVQIGPREALFAAAATLSDLHWLMPPPAVAELSCAVQIRYRRAPQPARLRLLPDGRAVAQFETPEPAVTPGQAAVFYDGDVVLGGGFIERSAEVGYSGEKAVEESAVAARS
jgi:tRNA-specific 2-thiouridylase